MMRKRKCSCPNRESVVTGSLYGHGLQINTQKKDRKEGRGKSLIERMIPVLE